MRLLASPWLEVFEEFTRLIARNALIVSPFITAQPLERLAVALERSGTAQVEILTNLAVENLIQGATDPSALAQFCRKARNATVRHLPGLHAKVYVADNAVAIVTSANLTEAGLIHNYEYGIQITDSAVASRIAEDLRRYGELGVDVPPLELDEIGRVSEELRERQSQVLQSARAALRREFEQRVEAAKESLRQLRARPGESTNAIFSRTMLYLLRKGSMTTEQLHPLIQRIHPDLCDDSIDRVINGVHFGKRWKHMARNAQQFLKGSGLVKFEGGKWRLV